MFSPDDSLHVLDVIRFIRMDQSHSTKFVSSNSNKITTVIVVRFKIKSLEIHTLHS